MTIYCSNPKLAEHYRMIISIISDVQRRKKIQKYLHIWSHDDDRFSSDHNMYYDIEDKWTKCIFRVVAFRYHEFYSVEYTAPLWGTTCNSAVLQGMPKGASLGSLLFHGSSDMLMIYRPIGIQHEDKVTVCIETKMRVKATQPRQ